MEDLCIKFCLHCRHRSLSGESQLCGGILVSPVTKETFELCWLSAIYHPGHRGMSFIAYKTALFWGLFYAELPDCIPRSSQKSSKKLKQFGEK